MASRCLADEQANHTLQPTALVHEVWLRLRDVAYDDHEATRGRFVAGAARVMRRVLVDHARRRRSAKRGGDWVRVTLCDAPVPSGATAAVDTVALDDALDRLSQTDAELVHLAELRLFGGLSLAQAAAVLGWPLSTAKNRWTYTVAMLSRSLSTLA